MTKLPADERPSLLFDLDGTLVDSLPDLTRALNALMSELGRLPLSQAEVKPMVGDGASRLVERAFVATGGLGDSDLPAMTDRFLSIYEGGVADRTTVYPGVVDALTLLKERGFAMAVCTNKPYRPSIEILQALGLLDYFAAVVGGDSIEGVKKPDPRMVTATLQALQATPRRSLFVGDSANDVGAAHGAGVPVAIVTFGYARGPVTELGADALIENFSELPDVAGRLLGWHSPAESSHRLTTQASHQRG